MKLSDKTLEILKNFSTINSNLFIEKGTKNLKTISESKNIFCSADVEETFPENIGILSLNKLLQTISMFDDPEFEFSVDHMMITESGSKNVFKYFYTASECLQYPKTFPKGFETPVEFALNEDTFTQITKASRATSLPDVKIKYDNNVVKLELMDRTVPTSNVFSLELPASGKTPMCASMKVANMKMISGDYNMFVGNMAALIKGTGQENNSMKYCIAMDMTNV